MKSVYFLSDAHLGCRSIPHDRTRERRLVHFLDGIKDKASAVYLLGDIFDFWYEYKTVVPRGYTRFLGKLSELADRGVEVLHPVTDSFYFAELPKSIRLASHANKEQLFLRIFHQPVIRFPVNITRLALHIF